MKMKTIRIKVHVSQYNIDLLSVDATAFGDHVASKLYRYFDFYGFALALSFRNSGNEISHVSVSDAKYQSVVEQIIGLAYADLRI